MKKTITGIVVLLAGGFVAYSQGTVSLGNYLALSTYIYVKNPSGTAIGGTAANTGNATTDFGDGSDWSVALLGAAGNNATSVSQLYESDGVTPAMATMETGGIDTTAGTWISTAYGVVPGTTGNGSAATVEVQVWYNDNGTITSYASSPYRGESALANTLTGGPNASGPAATPTGLPVGIGNITVSPVPEPSTIALGVMGASAFLMRLRRKK